jgi:UDP-2,3-diacylglucosamine pyrophosphatase LpxH
MCTTIAISDLHLGSRVSRTDLLADLLTADFDRLILNGDTVDGLNFNRFGPDDWSIVSQLRGISRKRELILIGGNHDGKTPVALELLGDLLKTDLREEYELKIGGKPYLVLHGDQFDDTLNMTWVGDAADWCYRRLQGVSRPTALWLKGRVKHLGGVVRMVRERAVRHAAAKGYAGIITGHTHYWDDALIEGIHYLNTGCWVDWPCSYIHASDGVVRVDHWGMPRLQPSKTALHSNRTETGAEILIAG